MITLPVFQPSDTPRGHKMNHLIPRVSILLTSRNHEKFLNEAIESALLQTYRNFELIIWDDASTDDSWSIIKQYNDSRIRTFRNDKQRYHYFKDFFEIAKGEYIAIHHSDDVWELEKLEKQVNFLDQHPEIGAVFSWVNIIDENGNINNDTYLYETFKQNNKTRFEWLRHFFIDGNAVCHPSVLIRKQCYLDCGLYNLALWQLPDFDMWIRLCLRYEIHVLPEHLVKLRWKEDGNNTSSVNRESVNRSSFEYYVTLSNYCRIAGIEELLKIFPSSEKYCTQFDADLEFALAMTAIESTAFPKHRLFGLQLLYKLMTSPMKAEKIRTVHHFDYMDFVNISKQIQIFASPSASVMPESPLSLDRGIQAFNQENIETAVECLSIAMTEEPDNPLPCAYLAFVCVHQGLFQEARDFIAQAIKIAPNRADLIAALGEVFLKNNRPFEAVEYLREAVHAQPDLFAAYPAFAQSLHLTGQSAEAVSLLKTAANLPSNAKENIQNVLLQILLECGDLSEFTEWAQRFSHGLPDDLLAARCLARFDESGEEFLETLSRIQAQLGDVIHSGRDNTDLTRNESGLTRIAFMASEFTSPHQLEQLFALFRYLPTERFFTLFILCDARLPKDDRIQMCGLLADSVSSIHQDEDDSAVEKLRALAPDILIDMDAYAPSERLAVFLSSPVPHKFLWGESPLPPIAPDVRTLAGSLLAVENMLPVVSLPGMGEVFDLPELPFIDDTARAMGEPPVLGCLVPAMGIGRNGWQLFAEALRQHPGATLVINLEKLGRAAQTFISGQFSREDVDPARLVFINACTAEEFCLAWQSIDLGLLPPVNPGGLALPTCLWMGKPCLIPASILPWSQRPSALLKALGREEWIAIGTPHYVDLVRQLAPPGQRTVPDPALRERMKALGLTDAKGFARGFAEAMTNLSRNGQPMPPANSDGQ
jgi:glycosyltransferase involved in cell wall biosynthesis/predicted O-linked N-acetylglucosamine transferase (SPINDLY family)